MKEVLHGMHVHTPTYTAQGQPLATGLFDVGNHRYAPQQFNFISTHLGSVYILSHKNRFSALPHDYNTLKCMSE